MVEAHRGSHGIRPVELEGRDHPLGVLSNGPGGHVRSDLCGLLEDRDRKLRIHSPVETIVNLLAQSAEMPKADDVFQTSRRNKRAAPRLQESHGTCSSVIVFDGAMSNQDTTDPEGPLTLHAHVLALASIDQLAHELRRKSVGPCEELACHLPVAQLRCIECSWELAIVQELVRGFGAPQGFQNIQLLAHPHHRILVLTLQGRPMQGWQEVVIMRVLYAVNDGHQLLQEALRLALDRRLHL
mmetsp:Transcript_130269/g.278380  ORF Transcript_130269/g.278380 Transcript_130269/m.278380 type:complete len:241 (+) Transcript_130269:875-1597(+)